MRWLFALVLVVSVLGCICSGPPADQSAAMVSTTLPAAPDEAVVSSAPATTLSPPQVAEKLMVSSTPELGGFLVDSNSMTLYTFGNDEPGKSKCYGDCARMWPPLTTPDDVFEGVGMDGVIGYASRTDGQSQVTYNGAPLYYYVQDKLPGEHKGEGFNGLWHVAATSDRLTPTTLKEGADAGLGSESEAPGESAVKLTTDSDKDTYTLSETFEPKVEVAPLNPQHNYTIVIYMHADGGSPSGGTDTQSMTGVESTTVWLHPFTNDQSGYSSENEHFTTPGIHHFEISVYDCTLIEASTGVENCARGKKAGIMERWEFPDGLKNQVPDAKVDKAITVVGA